MFPIIRQDQSRPKSGFKLVMIILTGLSGLLQFVGLTTPGWLILKTSLFKGQLGLFYAVFCVAEKCETKTYNEFERLTGDQRLIVMTEFQIETIAGFIFCIATTIILLKSLSESGRGLLRGGLLSAFLSACASLIAVGRIGNANMQLHDMFMKLEGESPYRFPYSVLLSGLGGSLMGICVLAMIGKLLLMKRDEDQVVLVQNPQAYSMESQADMPYVASQGGPVIHVQNTY